MAGEALEHVLIVDDDRRLTAVLARTLRRAGASRCEEASTVAEAVRLATAKVDVVVLDVVLPDGTGIDVIKAAVERRAHPAWIIVSGEDVGTELIELGRLGALTFLRKPFTAEAVVEAVASARRRRPSRVEVLGYLRASTPEQARHNAGEAIARGVLDEARGNITAAADALDISRQAMQQQLRTYGIRPVRPPTPGRRRRDEPEAEG